MIVGLPLRDEAHVAAPAGGLKPEGRTLSRFGKRMARWRAEGIVERIQEINRLSDKGNARQNGDAAVIVLSAAEAEGRRCHEVVEGVKIRYARDVSSSGDIGIKRELFPHQRQQLFQKIAAEHRVPRGIDEISRRDSIAGIRYGDAADDSRGHAVSPEIAQGLMGSHAEACQNDGQVKTLSPGDNGGKIPCLAHVAEAYRPVDFPGGAAVVPGSAQPAGPAQGPGHAAHVLTLGISAESVGQHGQKTGACGGRVNIDIKEIAVRRTDAFTAQKGIPAPLPVRVIHAPEKRGKNSIQPAVLKRKRRHIERGYKRHGRDSA